ncbi:MAG: response regulator, partial [Candidatus Sericytochromatia bacterium]|nr:response regulator [Candidatus Sericytochromatia bacterium]
LLIGDVTRLRQILINLISNAIKFTSKGEVYVHVKKNSSIYRETILEFLIKDTGIGISADKIEKLFKPFSQADSSTTRKYGGTGLGLVISKNLIELHNGKIGVKSEVHKGTSFYFTIQTDKPDIKTNNKNIEKIARLKDKNVLIIDENLTNIDTITYMLQNWQMNVMSINHNISEIMKLIKENNFSVIIMNMNNIDLNEVNIDEIRKYKDDEELPIVTLTFINDLQAKNQKHVYTYIQKPIKQEQMMKSLVNAIYNNKESKIKIKDKKITDKLSDKFDLEILIAEDNIINQKLALKIFSKLGYEADLVNNGLEAIEAVKNKRYDLIFMDLQMPEMDGIEATKYIIDNNYSNRPKIIALTANAMPEDQDRCFAAGMDDYLSKPVSIDIIKNVLIKWSEIIYS